MFISKKKLKNLIQEGVSDALLDITNSLILPNIKEVYYGLDAYGEQLQEIEDAVVSTAGVVSPILQNTLKMVEELTELKETLPEDRLAIADECMAGIVKSHNILAGGIDRNNEVILRMLVEGHGAILKTLNLLISPPQQEQRVQYSEPEVKNPVTQQPFQTIQEMAQAGGIISTGQVKEQPEPNMTQEQFLAQIIPNQGVVSESHNGLTYDGNGMPMPIRKDK